VRGGSSQWEIEVGRHDSNHQAIMPVNLNVVPNDAAIGIESTHPQPIAENHFIRVSWLILFWKDVAAKHRFYAERREQGG
jgi:hypothetical protein